MEVSKPLLAIKIIWMAFFLNCSHAQVPDFDIQLEALTINSMPGIQSFAMGQHNGKWLIVGGRLDGLHKAMGMGMMGPPFPTSGNNTNLVVIDVNTQQVWTKSLSSLPVDLQEQLSSTNTEFIQNGNYLYVFGGYGYSSAAGKHITFSKLTAINLPNVVSAIISGTSITACFRQTTDTAFRVTGGEIGKIYDHYYLVGGHNFDGTYHHMMGMGMFTQTYTNQIRKFSISDDGTTISITHSPSVTDNVNLHRRDYNLIHQIMPDGKEGLTAFSGVFQTLVDLPYLNCVNIDSTGYSVNNSFSQYYNHYQCANLAVYSANTNRMHNVFFGGIAQYYDDNGVLTQDDNVPFVKTIGLVTRDADGVMTEYKMPVEMPSLLGAGSEFIVNNTLPRYDNDVLQLDDLPNDTVLAGYIFGGISSPAANVFNSGMMSSNNTAATSQIFKVWLIKKSISTGLLQQNYQSNEGLHLQVSPNPSNGHVTLAYVLDVYSDITIRISDQTGRTLLVETVVNSHIGQNIHQLSLTENLPAGTYTVNVTAKGKTATQHVVIRK